MCSPKNPGSFIGMNERPHSCPDTAAHATIGTGDGKQNGGIVAEKPP